MKKQLSSKYYLFGLTLLIFGSLFFHLRQIYRPQPLDIAQIGQDSAPILDGTFLALESLSLDNIKTQMQESKDLGQDTIIISYLAKKAKSDTPCAGSQISLFPNAQEKVAKVMQLAAQHNLNIYFGLTWSHPDCAVEYTQSNKDIVLGHLRNYSHDQNPIRFVLDRYANHPSFAGWYIPDEPGLGVWDAESTFQTVYDYWTQYASAVKAKSNKPIVVAPFLCGVDGYLSPTQLATRAKSFQQQTGIHIQAWQDCVNVSGIALNTDNPNNRFTAHQYFQAISQAIGQNSFWVDIELGNCCTSQSGTNGGAYKPTSLTRLSSQLSSAPSQIASKRVSWVNQIQMTKSGPYRYHGSERLFHSYLARYVPASSFEVLQPASYKWITPPNTSYPDSGHEMFDGKIGENKIYDSDPASYLHSAYTGIMGNASVVIDLGRTRTINYIGVHTINYNSGGIFFPSSLKVECSSDNSQWTTLRTYSNPISRIDSEMVLGTPNNDNLSADCRYLRLTFANSSWTFLSEIELIGQKNSPSPTTKPGDLNGDGKVDIFDFNLLVANFGNPYTIFDYNAIVGNYGK